MAMWLLSPKVGIARSTGLLPSARILALEYFTVQRAFVSFCAALAGLPRQISDAVLPALIAAVSPSELRWRGAAMRLASMI